MYILDDPAFLQDRSDQSNLNLMDPFQKGVKRKRLRKITNENQTLPN